MDFRLTKSLDDIITLKEKSKQSKSFIKSLKSKVNHTRNLRKNEPYRSKSNLTLNINNKKTTASILNECIIKFLLPLHYGGSIIGNGGAAIKELMEISGAIVRISNLTNTHPITKDRILYISGTEDEVSLAQALVWEMIGQQTHASNEGYVIVWNPAAAKASPGEYDEVEVECCISIPASAGGLIIGKGGKGLLEIKQETGVNISINAQEEASVIQERIVTLSGTVGSCMAGTSFILTKIVNSETGCDYAVKGSMYPRKIVEHFEPSTSNTSGRVFSIDSNSHGYDNNKNNYHNTNGTIFNINNNHNNNSNSSNSNNKLEANTVIELSVPDSAVGAIFGKRGATLESIIELSGAQVVVSNRDTSTSTTTKSIMKRTITITGSPQCAQAAHTLIVHRLQQDSDV